MKFIHFIIIGLMILPIAEASIPQHSVADNFNGSVKYGIQSLGSLIVLKEPYEPEFINLTNFTTYILERYDSIIWPADRNSSISMGSTILTPGTIRQFTNLGNFSFNSLSNGSQSGMVIVVPERAQDFSISIDSERIGMNPSVESFTLDSDEFRVEIFADVPLERDAGNYPFQINLQFRNQTEALMYNLTIPEIWEWLVEENISNDHDIEAGTFQELGTITISNMGNEKFDVTVQALGNITSLLKFGATAVPVLRGAEADLPFFFSVPEVQPRGLYKGSIMVSSQAGTYVKNMTVQIRDTTPPSIYNISFDTNLLMTDNKVFVETKDNQDVLGVTISYFNETYDMVKDNFLFIHEAKFNRTETYFFEICATDVENNSVCESQAQTFELLNIVEFPELTQFAGTKFDNEVKLDFLTLTRDIDDVINIRLKKILYNGSPSIRIEAEGGQEWFMEEEGEGLTLTRKNTHDIYFSGDMAGPYTIIFSVFGPEYHEDLPDISYSGTLHSKDVPQPYSTEWYGSSLDCKPINAEDLDRARMHCEINYPINVDLTQIPFPVSESDKQSTEEVWEGRLAESKGKASSRLWHLWLLYLLAIIPGILTYLFATKLYPYLRMTRG